MKSLTLRKPAGKKVLVAMSGGVDSSVCALLLKKAGFDITGVTMCFGLSEDGGRPRCCGAQAIEDARKVCRKLEVKHYVLDFSEDLKDKVIDNFVLQYTKGKTPNPCIECNRHLKFKILLGKARAMGFDFLATGHYAKIAKNGQGFVLKRPKDKAKDQTYFLYPIEKDKLRFIKFPLEGLTKEKVREIAKKADLPVADKPQSQDACFIPDKDYRAFVLNRAEKASCGDIVDLSGNKLGTHKGIFSYTVGQRKGLNVAYKCPLYVISIDVAKNKIVIGEKKDLKAKSFMAGSVNMLIDKAPKTAFAKIRYREKETLCDIIPAGGKLRVIFKKPQEAITPGQSVVFYKNNTVLGGAIIEEVLHE